MFAPNGPNMTLLEILATQIPRKLRSEGGQLWTAGAVKWIDRIPPTLTAEVETESFFFTARVQLKGDEEILYSCGCDDYAERRNFCSHVWALLLAADRLKLLSQKGFDSYPCLIPFERVRTEVPEGISGADAGGSGIPKEEPGVPASCQPGRRPVPPRMPPKPPPPWKLVLQAVGEATRHPLKGSAHSLPPEWQLVYHVLPPDNDAEEGVPVEVLIRKHIEGDQYSAPDLQHLSFADVALLSDPADREIALRLLGAARDSYFFGAAARFRLWGGAAFSVLPMMCATGRCFLRPPQKNATPSPVRWDGGAPWEFLLQVRREAQQGPYRLTGVIRRDEVQHEIPATVICFPIGLIIMDGAIAPLDHGGAFRWIEELRKAGSVLIPAEEAGAWLDDLLRMPLLPRMDFPEELRISESVGAPRPRLKVAARSEFKNEGLLRAELSFDYAGSVIADDEPVFGITDAAERRRILRNDAAEAEFREALAGAGFHPLNGLQPESFWAIYPANLHSAVLALVGSGWHVEAEGRAFRPYGRFDIRVVSGVDWLELHASIEFGDQWAPLSRLLSALNRCEKTVLLDDGSLGILPEEWLRRYGFLAGLGTVEGDHLRFKPSQAALLDLLLAAEPAAACDEVFARARARLRNFEKVSPCDAPPAFSGQLRAYQKEGLGWLHFLRDFRFGGCLADDMGLGKTVQVLALIESRRELREKMEGPEKPGPSLVVVPRSLVFNWKAEAARFTPHLRVLDFSSVGRAGEEAFLEDSDLVIATYGTLRADAPVLKKYLFDYVILDEAQMIKNPNTATAKAARLLHGRHRLALSGTPVQNHLGELWSIFEFLNPGMLGTASVFRVAAADLRTPGGAARELLARALRPFILRRTKTQVARELPEKVDQTIYCELEAPQRRLYDEMRKLYRARLLQQVERRGIARSRNRILEALLRLRQAALHPGLLDPARTNESCAKLDSLLPQLDQLVEEGHKALVFSQFTSMLEIVRRNLKGRKIVYDYLDGQTRNRAAVVERFQTDPRCSLLLISLRAGGLGLNLTEAEYVFLLDPWWNPAVEMQAIDRSHRIGQTRTVFAYRLIARGTVEEKVLELQQKKRDLADSIIEAKDSLLSGLSAEDLALLLS
jgi:superfamily II DNA or RNA helicase